MSYETFDQLVEQLVHHFQNKEYAEALELVMTEGDKFSNDRIDVDYWKMVSAARVENRDLVYQVARQMLADGLWLGEYMLRKSPSFEPLQGNPEFEQIVTAFLEAKVRDVPSGEPIVITKFPTNHSRNSPLLIALHGNHSSAKKTLSFWELAVKDGWLTEHPKLVRDFTIDGDYVNARMIGDTVYLLSRESVYPYGNRVIVPAIKDNAKIVRNTGCLLF